jgi:hypothetical protein
MKIKKGVPDLIIGISIGLIASTVSFIDYFIHAGYWNSLIIGLPIALIGFFLLIKEQKEGKIQ